MSGDNAYNRSKIRTITMSVDAVQDKNISFKAKGILAYMKTRAGQWKFYEKEIMQNSTDGRDAVRSGIKELIDAGYIFREKNRTEDGKIRGYAYHFSDYKEDLEELFKTEDGKSDNGSFEDGKTNVGKTDNGKPATIINSLNKQKKKDNKEYIYYLEFTKMTEEEYNKLLGVMTVEEREDYMERFNVWITGQKETVRKNRDAYLTILKWFKDAKKKEVPSSKPYYKNKNQQAQSDFDDLKDFYMNGGITSDHDTRNNRVTVEDQTCLPEFRDTDH